MSHNHTHIKKFQDLIEKTDALKKQNPLDLSSDQDLSIAIMHLISIEEHFIFSGAKLENSNFYDLVTEIRQMRKEMMEKIIKNSKGELWCISKHLLGASMRLIEVGTKQQSLGHHNDAYNFFNKAYELYSLFWGLQMELVDIGKVKEIDSNAINKKDTENKSLGNKLGSVVKKVIDCCIE